MIVIVAKLDILSAALAGKKILWLPCIGRKDFKCLRIEKNIPQTEGNKIESNRVVILSLPNLVNL